MCSHQSSANCLTADGSTTGEEDDTCTQQPGHTLAVAGKNSPTAQNVPTMYLAAACLNRPSHTSHLDSIGVGALREFDEAQEAVRLEGTLVAVPCSSQRARSVAAMSFCCCSPRDWKLGLLEPTPAFDPAAQPWCAETFRQSDCAKLGCQRPQVLAASEEVDSPQTLDTVAQLKK
jgi:hypothetical protein